MKYYIILAEDPHPIFGGLLVQSDLEESSKQFLPPQEHSPKALHMPSIIPCTERHLPHLPKIHQISPIIKIQISLFITFNELLFNS